jgi:putative nucleotidyltransferase with HDIG domain
MKAFHSLTQHLGKRRRESNPSSQISEALPQKKAILPDISLQRLHNSRRLQKIHPPVMLGVAVVALTSVVGYRFYNQPRLLPGTVSPATIVAPRDGSFPDLKTTEAKRREAQTATIPIWQRDEAATAEIEKILGETLARIEELRQLVAPVPWLNPQILSSGIQQYLRSCPEPDWQALLAAVNSQSPTVVATTAQQQKAIAELTRYRQQKSPAEWQSLLRQISQVRQRYQQAAVKIALLPADIQQEIPILLQLSPQEWWTTKRSLQQAAQQILMQGIPPGMPSQLLAEPLRLSFNSASSPAAQSAAIELFLALRQDRANLMVDREATKQRAQQAAEAVTPVFATVNRGDIIVKTGETITQEKFVLLDEFGLSRRRINWTGLATSGIAVTLAVITFYGVQRRLRRRLRRRDHLLLCLLSLSAPLIAITDLRYLNLPAIGFLTSSFYGPSLAVTQVALLAGLSGFAAENLNWEYLLAAAAAGLLAAGIAGRLRSRDELAFLGGGIGLAQGGVYFLVQLTFSAAAGTIWYAILPAAAVYGLLGLAWAVVALGLSAYLERLFDVITPIRLVELSNPNCPLLKRLVTEAPGTFQHTLFVACLAEAAGRALHCNVELIRAGTLYHDIGKMHDPLAFIENQMGGANKHDEINHPSKSAEIIKKHVSEGLVMARKYGLPRVVRDFIPEHQGTLLIAYFYHQAKQQAGQNGFAEADFRYNGPIPQSRETGIVMLADGCEAALRSLRDATPEIAAATVKKIFKAHWQDGQLQDSGIAYEELPAIADIFIHVWQQFHHQRIAYPKV